ncbi:M23 family metallopeptidase [bacterium]|nr:M23 family metallopeptidase [bacterium]MBU1676340.1 M23 family metallopeptidase [bacterium]
MLLRFPPHTRIIVVPSDDQSTNEFSISRRLLVAMTLLLVLVTLLFLVVILSYSTLLQQARQVPELQGRLVAANAQLVRVQELNRELDQMRDMQERVLTMLGVNQLLDDAAEDTAADAGDPMRARLGEVAGVIMTPPPDVWPVEGHVTREFEAGDLVDGLTPHYGIDLVAPVDTEVRAAGRGIVQSAGWDDDLGNFVEIRHGFGYVTIYGHCSRLIAQAGDRVEPGQVIAALGGTGRSSAPHLHFEIWRDGEAVDPRNVIPGSPGE